MGLIAQMLTPLLPSVRTKVAPPGLTPSWEIGRAALPNLRYETLAGEGYGGNELVFACIEELSTSAAEPRLQYTNGEKWYHRGPVIDLLEMPNPFMDRFEFFATLIMYRAIAGNAYALKVRSRSGKLVELWLMRPDRITIVPSGNGIAYYEYNIGDGNSVRIPPEDVIHWKTRNPLSQLYGMPPLFVLSGRVDVDNFMRDFVKAFFSNAGVPGGILNVKGKLPPGMNDEIRRRFRQQFAGPGSWHELLILDNTESSFTPTTSSLGNQGLVVPELDEIMEARICSVFAVPQSLVGTRTSYQNGGYANKRAEEQHFWTGTLIPLYKEIAGKLTLGLRQDFPSISEIAFDMDDVRALQEDMDKVATRWSNLAVKGVASLQEAREKVGLPKEWGKDDVFLIPSSSIGVGGEDLSDPGTGADTPANRQGDSTAVPEGNANPAGVRTATDPQARGIYDQMVALKAKGLTMAQIAGRLGVGERTLYRYEAIFRN